MDRKTLKTSTIFVAVGDRLEVFRSMEDVPPELRRRLHSTTNGVNAATLLIADRNGREELVRAIQGAPGSVPFRVAERSSKRRKQWEDVWSHRRGLVELAVVPFLALLMWLVLTLK